MKKHVKIYYKAHGYNDTDWVSCQVCQKTASDVHHCVFRSQGGKDTSENLIALCRACHELAHFRGKKEDWLHLEHLQEIVNLHLSTKQ